MKDHLLLVKQVASLLFNLVRFYAYWQVVRFETKETSREERHEVEQDDSGVAVWHCANQFRIAIVPYHRLLLLWNGAGSSRDVPVLPFQRV